MHTFRIAAAVSCLTALAMAPLHAQVTPTPTAPFSLEQLLPADTGFVIGTNVQSLWKLTSTVRSNPMLGMMLANLTEGIAGPGSTVETDILPWAGQFAFEAPASAFSGKPVADASFIYCIQVTDQAAFDRFFTKLQKSGWLGYNPKWPVTNVDGYAVTTALDGKNQLVAQYTKVPGWFLMGYGMGEVRKVLDAASGVTQSGSNVPAWKKGIALIPTTSIFWNAFDVAQLSKESFNLTGTSPGRVMSHRGRRKPSATASASSKGTYAVFDDIYVNSVDLQATSVHSVSGIFPKSEVAADVLRNLGGYAAQPFVQYPDASLVYAFNKPKSALKFIRSMALGLSADPADAKDWQSFLKEIPDVDKYKATINAPVEVALTSRVGHGLGLVVAIKAQDHATALRYVKLLASGLGTNEMPLVRVGDTWKMNWTTSRSDRSDWAGMQKFSATHHQDILPEIEVDGSLIQITTAPYWIHSRTPETGAVVPTLAENQLSAFAGNYRFLEPLKVWADKGIHNPQSLRNFPTTSKWIDAIGLKNATMYGTAKADPTTGDLIMTSTTENWDYNAAIGKLTAMGTSAFTQMMTEESSPNHHTRPKHRPASKHRSGR